MKARRNQLIQGINKWSAKLETAEGEELTKVLRVLIQLVEDLQENIDLDASIATQTAKHGT